MPTTVRIVFALAALIFLGFAVHIHLMTTEARSWPSTEGVVSEVGVLIFGSGSDGTTGTVEEHNPRIRYMYSVAGRAYSGHRFRVWDVGFSRAGLSDNYAGNRKRGDSVTVFYDPARPENAVIDLAYPVAPVSMFVLASVVCGAVASFATPIARGLSSWPMHARL